MTATPEAFCALHVIVPSSKVLELQYLYQRRYQRSKYRLSVSITVPTSSMRLTTASTPTSP